MVHLNVLFPAGRSAAVIASDDAQTTGSMDGLVGDATSAGCLKQTGAGFLAAQVRFSSNLYVG